MPIILSLGRLKQGDRPDWATYQKITQKDTNKTKQNKNTLPLSTKVLLRH
jgi:hypothetical protein